MKAAAHAAGYSAGDQKVEGLPGTGSPKQRFHNATGHVKNSSTYLTLLGL
jgi:hypothetical protein